MANTSTVVRLLHSPEEVAESLHVSRTGVYGLLASGALKSVRIGRLRRIPDEALQDYIRQLTAEAS